MSTPPHLPEPLPPTALPLTYATPPRLPKSPLLAVVLSVAFPGLGQIYNGQINKAVAFFGGFVASLFAAINIDPMPFALFIPFVLLFGLIDAARSAAAINNRFLGGKPEPEDESLSSPAWGGLLVAMGLVLLLHNLGWLDIEWFKRYWPVLLIVAGVVFIRRSLEARKSTGAGSSDAPSL